MKKHLKIVENNKATIGLRILNFIIDRIVIYALFFGFGLFSSLMFEMFSIEFFLNITIKLTQLNRFQDILLTLAIYFLYIFLIEYFTAGRSVGKLITGTKVIGTDGEKPSLQDFFIRNISRLVPFDGLSFFGENGWHDSWSETRVVNIRKYMEQTATKTDIDMIGSKEMI